MKKSDTMKLILSFLLSVGIFGCDSAEMDWIEAKQNNNETTYSYFIRNHPDSRHAPEARQWLEESRWKECIYHSGTIYYFEKYLNEFPEGNHAQEARRLLAERKSKIAAKEFQEMTTKIAKTSDASDKLDIVRSYIKNNPQDPYLEQAKITEKTLDAEYTFEKEENAYKFVAKLGSYTVLKLYSSDPPNSRHMEDISKMLDNFTTEKVNEACLVKWDDPRRNVQLPNADRMLNREPLNGGEAAKIACSQSRKIGIFSFIVKGIGDTTAKPDDFLIVSDKCLIFDSKEYLTPCNIVINEIIAFKGTYSYFTYRISDLGTGIWILDHHILLPVGSTVKIVAAHPIFLFGLDLEGGNIKITADGLELQPGTQVYWPKK